jgi:hypothetical protein
VLLPLTVAEDGVVVTCLAAETVVAALVLLQLRI